MLVFLCIFFVNNFYKKNLYAQKLPQIFQKPITQIPDTNKKIAPINLENNIAQKEFFPKFLPIHFNIQNDTNFIKTPSLGAEGLKTPPSGVGGLVGGPRSYTQIGLGNYGNIWIKNKTQSPILWKNWRFFSEILFQNAQKGAVAERYSGNGNFGAVIGTQFTHKKIAITAQLAIKGQQNRFYNYDPNRLKKFDKDTLSQVFTSTTFQTQILYADTAKKRFLEGEIKFQFWNKWANKNIAQVNENNVGFRVNYTQILHNSKNLHNNTNSFQKFLKNTIFNSEIEFWLMPRKEKELYFKRNFLQLSPNITYQLPNYPIKITGGFRVSYDNDDIRFYKRLHLYPNFAFLYYINKNLDAKILYDGQTIRNNLANFSEQNPWIEPNITIIHTQQLQNIRLKFHYNSTLKNPNHKYSLYVEQGFSQNQNMPLWINSSLDSAKFSLVYDKISITNFVLGGRYFLETKEGTLQTKANFSHYKYQTFMQMQAWHLPQFTTNLEVRFLPKKGKKYLENMQFWLKLQGEYQRKYLNAQTKEQNLLNIVDLSLGGEYLFSKKTSAFLSFFNVFNQKNPTFAGYIAQGFSFLAGVTIKI